MYDENSNAAAAAAAASSTSSTGLMSQLLNVKDSRWLQLEVSSVLLIFNLSFEVKFLFRLKLLIMNGHVFFIIPYLC